MSKRTAAIVIAFLSCFIAGILQKTPRVTWDTHTRNTLFSLVSFVALFYIGLDLVIAPETSLWYRIEKNLRSPSVTPGVIRGAGIFIIVTSLLAGWSFLGQLLGLIK
ncbi:MAG TPA: hypothetical protein VMP08_07710 [Anaerolineae bacterium]|nr:hypothetical protein [Anaerolineae bacterium]